MVAVMGPHNQSATDAMVHATLLPAGIVHEKLAEVAARGARKPVAPNPPVATDTAIIMYTSGTTGAPKVGHAPSGSGVEGSAVNALDVDTRAHHSNMCYTACSHIRFRVHPERLTYPEP
jgi:acyl-coenzyme A synthetase/AMP-(fatty) acid ligase